MRPEDEDAVALEIQTDCLFLLSVLCEGDVHRKVRGVSSVSAPPYSPD